MYYYTECRKVLGLTKKGITFFFLSESLKETCEIIFFSYAARLK